MQIKNLGITECDIENLITFQVLTSRGWQWVAVDATATAAEMISAAHDALADDAEDDDCF